MQENEWLVGVIKNGQVEHERLRQERDDLAACLKQFADAASDTNLCGLYWKPWYDLTVARSDARYLLNNLGKDYEP